MDQPFQEIEERAGDTGPANPSSRFFGFIVNLDCGIVPGVKESDYRQLPEGERRYFLQCDGCGDYFDKRQIDEVFFRVINNHKGKLNIQHEAQGESIE